ncbi:MAG: MarR family transcriptional regulator [Spirochaeta sp.]|nr:MarR family transcriptional regulator [Spirochaeta sp.]
MATDSFRATELFQMHELVIQLDRAAQIILAPLGITYNDFLVLLAVYGNPSSSQQEIAQSIGVGKASISLRTRALSEKGLVVQSLNPENRRETLLVLSGQGQRVYQEAASILTERAGPVFDTLGSNRERFRADLGALIQELHNQMFDPKENTR